MGVVSVTHIALMTCLSLLNTINNRLNRSTTPHIYISLYCLLLQSDSDKSESKLLLYITGTSLEVNK